MNTDPENFDALRRLLTLKRYEQPPPGYFNSFSSQVIARIKAGERGEPASVLQRLFGEATLWQRLFAALESRPGYAGALGAAVCALLLSGIVYSENSPVPVAQALIPAESSALFPTTAATAAMAANGSLGRPEYSYSDPNSVALTGGSMGSGSLFDQVQLFQAQPASLIMADGN